MGFEGKREVEKEGFIILIDQSSIFEWKRMNPGSGSWNDKNIIKVYYFNEWKHRDSEKPLIKISWKKEITQQKTYIKLSPKQIEIYQG